MVDDDELKDIFGLQRCDGIDADLGGFKRALCLEITTEFTCKALSI